MRISIHASGFVITEAMRSFIEGQVHSALGWAGSRMRKLAVSVSDINGPRGGCDKRCKIDVRLAGGQAVTIEDTETDLYVAIRRATERADRVLVRKLERLRMFQHARIDAGDRPDDADDEHRAPRSN